MRCKFEGEVTFDANQYAHIAHGPASSNAAVIFNEAEALKIALKAVQLYAEQHPRPPHVTMSQAAEMLHLSRSTVSKIMRTGKLRYNACGLIPIEQVDQLLAAAE